VNHFEFHSQLTEKSKLFKNLTEFAIKMKENVFDYIPLTFFVEIDIGKPKFYAKAMVPFFNSFYALEDNKKKVIKYFLKAEEFNLASGAGSTNLGGTDAAETGNGEDPYDE
jgi:hypothetical protein